MGGWVGGLERKVADTDRFSNLPLLAWPDPGPGPGPAVQFAAEAPNTVAGSASAVEPAAAAGRGKKATNTGRRC